MQASVVHLSLLLAVYEYCIPHVSSYASNLCGSVYVLVALRQAREWGANLHVHCLTSLADSRKTTPAAVVLREFRDISL